MKPAPRHGASVRQVEPRPRVAAFNYPTRWKRLRKLILAEEPACRQCGRAATEVHHIESIASGGEPYELDNLMPICKQCHDDEHGGGNRRG